jgi:hypothetical protein
VATVDAQHLAGARLEVSVAAVVEDERRSFKDVARDLIVKVERVRASSRRVKRHRGQRESEKRERVLHRPRSI